MKKQHKKEKNILLETDNRNGRKHYTVSREWPDGDRLRRRCPNLQLARQLLQRINGAIFSGQWQALREELNNDLKKKKEESQPVEAPVTFSRLVKEFKTSVISRGSTSDWPTIQGYMADAMTEFFGADTPLVDITSRRVEEFIGERRKEVRACTVNKPLSASANVRQGGGLAVRPR
jgi:hypothetical protein